MVRQFNNFNEAANFYENLLEKCEQKILVLLKERERLKDLIKHNKKMSIELKK